MRVVVIGGGVVGLSCAVELGRAGHEVVVYEPDEALQAPSWNNAGHIATEQVAPLASYASIRSMPRRHFARGGALDLPLAHAPTWLGFGARLVAAAHPSRFRAGSAALSGLLAQAMPAWRRLADILGAAPLVRDEGHLVYWQTAEGAHAGKRAWAQAGTGTATLHQATDRDMAMMARLLGAPVPHDRVLRFERTGQVHDLAHLAQMLRARFLADGGTIVAEGARLDIADGLADVGDRRAGAVLVAAGIASGAIMRSAGHRTPIVAERGYHIRAAASDAAADWPANAPPVVFEDRSMIVTRYADQVQAASFVEIAALDAPPDQRKWRRLERHVRELGLPMAPPFTRWMGARPTFPDYLPALGRSRRVDNLFYAFGHQHLGLTLAAITAQLMTALIGGEAPSPYRVPLDLDPVDLAPFDLARFARSRPGSLLPTRLEMRS